MKQVKCFSVVAAIVLMAGITFGIRELSLNNQRTYRPNEANLYHSTSDIDAEQGIAGALGHYKMIGGGNTTEAISMRQIVEAYNRKNSTKSSLSPWDEMGPDNIGGRVRAILWDERDPSYNTLYAGGVAGGLFISKNRGTYWEQVKNIDANISISCICQAPDGTIFIGTGEDPNMEGTSVGSGGNSFTSGALGYGIYRTKTATSEDFELIESTKPASSNQNVSFAYVNRIAYHPTDNILYAGTNRGLYISENKGDTWVGVGGAEGASIDMNCTQDIKITLDGAVFYSIKNTSGGALGAGFVVKKGNSKLTEKEIVFSSNNIKDFPKEKSVGRIEIAVAKKNSKELLGASGYVYLSVADNEGASIGVYRSKDQGSNWEVKSNLDIESKLFGSGSQGKYDNTIAIFPNNLDHVLIGGIAIWKGRIQKGDKGIYNWERLSINSAMEVSGQDDYYSYIYDSRYVHADAHALEFHPNPKTLQDSNTVFLGTDGGVHLSTDGGATFKTLNKGFNVTQFFALAVGNDGSLIGGTQDNSTPYIWKDESDSNMRALMLWSGDGGWAAISSIHKTKPARKKALFLTSQYAYFARTQGNYLNVNNNQEWGIGINFNGDTLNSLLVKTGAFVTPLILWETVNDKRIKDSTEITLKIGDTVVRGIDKIVVAKGIQFQAGDSLTKYHFSKGHFDYPFYPIIAQSFTFGEDTNIIVKNPIQSRFFIGGVGSVNKVPHQNAGVYMTDQAIDFSKVPPRWRKVFEYNYNGNILSHLNEIVNHIAISKNGNTLYISTNKRVNNDINRSYLYRVSNLLDADPANPNDWSTGTTLSRDELSSKIISFPSNRLLTSISIDPNDENSLLLTFGGFRSSANVLYVTGADTPTPTSKAMNVIVPEMPVYASLIEMSNSNVAFLGSEYGMLMTTNLKDPNPTWVTVNDGMNSVPVHQLIQQKKDMPFISIEAEGKEMAWRGTDRIGAIYAATHGRGIFRNSQYEISSRFAKIEVKDPSNKVGINNPEKQGYNLLKVYPNPAVTQANIEFTLKNPVNEATILVYNLSGKEVLKDQILSSTPNSYIYQFNCAELKKGIYLIRIIAGSETLTSKIVVK